MVEFLTDCFQGPALVASTLVCCVMAYWVMVSLGAVDLDAIDLDLDLDVDTDVADLDADVDVSGGHSPLSVGMMALKFFNLGQVPLMVWMSFFAIALWALTMLFDRGMDTANTIEGFKALARNGGVSLFLAKLCTQPMRGLFDTPEVSGSQDLLGTDLHRHNFAGHDKTRASELCDGRGSARHQRSHRGRSVHCRQRRRSPHHRL